jgi:hypothetical protein
MKREIRRAFLVGQARARVRTSRQAFARWLYVLGVLAFALFGPFRWWIRILLLAAFMLVYGAIASWDRFKRRL